MVDKDYLFYKERKLSNKKETLGFRIDSNIKKELVKHFDDKYGANGLSIGMNEIVLDYLNDTPLIRTNLPIICSLLIPKDGYGIANVTIDDFTHIKDDDPKKDKLYLLKSSHLENVKDLVFKEKISINEIDKDNFHFWIVYEVFNSFDEFFESKRYNHDFNQYNIYESEFNEFLNDDYTNYYKLDNSYVVIFLLNNFLDSLSDGSYGNKGKHYGTIFLEIEKTKYFIIFEFTLKHHSVLGYSCYLVNQETFESILKGRNKELYLNYKTMEFLVNEELNNSLLKLSSEIDELKMILEDKEKLYNNLLSDNLEKLEKARNNFIND